MSLARLGRYEIEDEVGRGGMSVVYRATDPVLDRKVALKVLHPHLADRADARARFTREARAVARFQHPHIVEVFDYAPPESDRAYIVTEYIDGPTLRAFAEAHPIRHAEVAALIMIPVLEALEHAHRHGIVHRDVKPENVMVRPDGTPVLMDFGIAQMVDMQTLTATGTMLGSPAHMAPEVVNGEEVGPRSDLFSAGTVLYWLVCGALPFTGPNPAALFRRVLECRFDPVLQRRPHAGRPMARLIERCLAREPADRPASAQEVADALRDMLRDGGVVEAQAELTGFFRDPEVYQDHLARRLAPAYVLAARRALQSKATARALDLLDRALGKDEENPEAQALLARIERGRRMGRTLRAAGAVAAAAAVLGGLWWLGGDWFGEVEPAVAVTVTPAPDAGGTTTSTTADSAMVPVTPPRRLDAAAPPDPVVPPDAAVDAAPLPPDAARKAVAAAVIKRPPRPEKPAAEPDAGIVLPARPAIVPIKGAHAGEVYVNQRRHGFMYEIMAAGGLKLPPGPHHIRVEHQHCETQHFEIVVRAGDQRLPPTQYVCRYKPALLRVASNRLTDVRGADGRFLGRTNQEIELPMKHYVARLQLTVGDPTGQFQTRNITLEAGKTTSDTVQF